MKNHSSSSQGPIKAGSTILVEEPFVFILSSKEQRYRCDHCFTKGKVLKCSGCQYIHYCGRSCQKDAWPEHKTECAGYRRVLPRVPPDAARLMARIIRKLAYGGAHTKGHYTKTSFRVWKDLMSHYQDLKVDSRRMEHFTSLCTVLFQFLTDISLPNSVELMGIYGRMCINSFTILDPEMLSIGTGLYLGTSILDHNCEPNAVAVFHGTTINIRTLVDLPSLDFSKVFISYIDLLNTPFERQTELQTTYYFLCQCERCLDQQQISLMHAAQCPNPKCDYPVQIPWREDIKLFIKADENESQNESQKKTKKDIQNGFCHNGESSRVQNSTNGPEKSKYNKPYKNITNKCDKQNGCDTLQNKNNIETLSNGFHLMCLDKNGSSLHGEEDDEGAGTNGYLVECPKCKTTISEQFVQRFKEVMEFTNLHLQNMRDKSITYVDVCRACLDKQKGVLHPLCLFHVQTLDLAMDACLQHELWDPAISYASLLLPGFKNYYGDRHPMYGLLLVKLGKLLLFKERSQEALDYLKKAADVLKITHGLQHQLWRDSLAPLTRQAEAEVAGIMSF